MEKELIVVKAKLKLKSTKDGGRQGGIASGYRPNHVFEYKDDGSFSMSWIGDIQFDDSEWILPSEERIVTVRFLEREEVRKYLEIGKPWWIHEGGREVGKAEILEIENK